MKRVMKGAMKRAMLIVSSLVMSVTVYGYQVNKQAPDFSLTDVNGKSFSINQLKGKTVVLEWLNYGCPYVKKHYDSGNMQKLQKKYTGQGVVWLSIVSSAPGKQGYYPAASMKKINAQKGNAASAVLLDPSGSVGRKYRAKTTPHMFVINKAGTLVYNGAIDSKPSTDAEDIPSSTNYVAQAVDATLAGKTVPKAVTQPYGCSVKYK